MERRCPRCGLVKAKSEFNSNRSGRGGVQTYCRVCARLYRMEYEARNRDKIAERRRATYAANAEIMREKAKARRDNHPESAALASRKWLLQKKYRLTPEQYEAMVAERGGRCDICERVPAVPPRRKVALHVDHCHASGVVRGLLCTPCNTALGQFKDDPDILRRAVAYLASPPLSS